MGLAHLPAVAAVQEVGAKTLHGKTAIDLECGVDPRLRPSEGAFVDIRSQDLHTVSVRRLEIDAGLRERHTSSSSAHFFGDI